MGDGVSSVHDLNIVISAETEKFAAGISTARDLVKSFVGDSVPMVGQLDKALGLVGSTAEALPGKFAAIVAKANPIIGGITAAWDLAKSAAEKLGVTEDVEKAQTSFGNLFSTIKEAGLSGLGLAAPATAVGDFNAKLVEGESVAKDWSEQVQDAARDALNSLTEAADMMEASIASGYKRPDQLTDKQLPLAITATKTAIVDLEMSGNVLFRNMEAAGTGFGDVVRDNGEAVEVLRQKLEGLNDEAGKRGWDKIEVSQEQFADLSTYTDALEKQTIGLRIQVETFGMAASAAKAYAEKRQLLHDTGELPINPDDLAAFNKHLENNLMLRQRLEGMQQGKRDHDQDREQDQDAIDRAASEDERAERTRAAAVERMQTTGQREIDMLRAKTVALGLGADAVQVATYQEKLFYDLKQKGIQITAEERAEIMRLTADYAEAARAQVETQRALSAITASTGVMSHAVDGAFSTWTTSGAFSVSKMTASILQDFAKLTLQMTLLQPLFGGGSVQGGGLLGGWLNSVIGGFRAEGGAVNAGVPYVVGERGPELFVPPGSGEIIPNHALGGRGGAVLNLSIDARGATPDAVALLEGRIPGLIMQTVQDAQQRGAL